VRPAVVTKVVRVHLAGGLAVDVHVPTGTVVLLDAVIERALTHARRAFALAGEPLVVALDASQALPGDVAQPALPARERAPQRRR
jgi:hypothetical protein